MAEIQNLSGTYTVRGLDKVKTLLSELDSALSEITVDVVWSDEK